MIANTPPPNLTEAERSRIALAINIIDAIDTGGKPEWQHLRPLEHAAQLPTAAAPLRAIIQSDKVHSVVQERKTASRDAGTGKTISRTIFQVRLLLFATAAALAFWHVVSVNRLDMTEEWLLVAAVWWGFVAAVVLDCCRRALIHIGILRLWQNERRTAEMLRREIFDQIMDSPIGQKPDDMDASLLKLEYFRRFQLAAQINYYGTRIKEQHGQSGWLDRAKILLSQLIAATLIVCTLIAVGSGAEQGHLTGLPPWFLGALHTLNTYAVDTYLVAAMLIAAVACLALWLGRGVDSRSLYRDAMQELTMALTTDLEPSRAAAARGDFEPARKLVGRVHQAMRREHEIWLGR